MIPSQNQGGDGFPSPNDRGRAEHTGAPLVRDLLGPLRRAIDLYLAGDFAAAESRLRSLLESAPDEAQGHHHLGVVLRARGQFGSAIAHLERALELDPHLVGAAERLERYRAERQQERGGSAA